MTSLGKAEISLFALDSYIRNLGQTNDLPAPLGATIIGYSTPSGSGFSATAYEVNGEVIIAFRGTDDLSDLPDGWPEALGWMTPQAMEAIEFYQQVKAETSLPITVTGHSLGGALAGFLSSTYGIEGYLFEHMPFEKLTQNVYLFDTLVQPIYKDLHDKIFGEGMPGIVPDYAGIKATHLDGEALSLVRGALLDFYSHGLDMSFATFYEGPLDRHKFMSLLSIRQYAEESEGHVAGTDWQDSFAFTWNALLNDNVALHAGATPDMMAKYGTDTPYIAAIDALARSIGTGTSNGTAPPETNAAIDVLFEDGGDIGRAVSDGLSNGSGQVYGNLSVLYATALAWQGLIAPVADGVVAYADDIILAKFDDLTWAGMQGSVEGDDGSIMAFDSVFEDVLALSGVSDISVNVLLPIHSFIEGVASIVSAGPYTGELPSVEGLGLVAYVGTGRGDHIVGTQDDDIILAGGDSENAGVGGVFSGGPGNDLVVGSEYADIFNEEDGNDILIGGDGQDEFNISSSGGTGIVLGGDGTDRFHANGQYNIAGGTGDDTFNINVDEGVGGIAWGGSGQDQFNFTSSRENINVLSLHISGITEENFANISRAALSEALINQNLGALYIIINAEPDDILAINGHKIDVIHYDHLATFGGEYTPEYIQWGGYLDDLDTYLYGLTTVGDGDVAQISIQDPPESYSPDEDPYGETAPFFHLVGYQDGVFGISVEGEGPRRIQGSDMLHVGDVKPPQWDSYITPTVNIADITIENSETGTSGNDSMAGTSQRDRIMAGPGNDVVSDAPESSFSARMSGGGEADIYDGGSGLDTIDYSNTTAGVQIDLNGQTASGSETGIDQITGFENAVSGAGDDRIWGTEGGNVLSGGDGDDTLDGGSGADTLNGGNGFDIASYESSETGLYIHTGDSASNTGDALGDVASGIEGVFGSWYDDELIFVEDGISVWAHTGDDTITMVGMDTTVYGEEGDDSIYTGPGTNIVYGGAGNDDVLGDEGADLFYLEDGDDFAVGGAGADLIVGDEGDDEAHGGDDADTLTGDAGNDQLHGDGGNDLIDGGDGDDWLVGGNGNDTFVVADQQGEDGIADFQVHAGLADGDVLEIDSETISNFVDLMAEATEGDDVSFINLGNGQYIALYGVALSQLTSADFSFV